MGSPIKFVRATPIILSTTTADLDSYSFAILSNSSEYCDSVGSVNFVPALVELKIEKDFLFAGVLRIFSSYCIKKKKKG